MRLLLAGFFLALTTFPAAAAGPWYYCDPLHGFYPYVGHCPVPWRAVDIDRNTDGQAGSGAQPDRYGQSSGDSQAGTYGQSQSYNQTDEYGRTGGYDNAGPLARPVAPLPGSDATASPPGGRCWSPPCGRPAPAAVLPMVEGPNAESRVREGSVTENSGAENTGAESPGAENTVTENPGAEHSVTENPVTESAVSTGFLQGQADRQSWESWLHDLRGDYRAGAEYWAAYRGSPGASACSAASPTAGGDWTTGCIEAQQRLAPFDKRRQRDPQYRLGWDNPPPGSLYGARDASQIPALAQPDAPPQPDNAVPPSSDIADVPAAQPPAPSPSREATDAPMPPPGEPARPALREAAEPAVATPDPYSRDVAEAPAARIPGYPTAAPRANSAAAAAAYFAHAPARDIGANRIGRGWLGLKTQEVTPEIAESLGLPKAAGALVVSVAAGSPARLTGLEPGDVIASYRGRNILRPHDLDLAVAATPPGQAVKIKLWRDGHELTRSPVIKAMAGAAEPRLREAEAGRAPKRPAPQAIARSPEREAQIAADAHGATAFIDQWSGNSRLTTRPFHANGPWEIQWATSSGPFVIELAKLGGRSDVIASQTHQASSSSFVAEGGDYYLKVIANNPWSIKLVNVPPLADADANVGAAPGGASGGYGKTLDGEYRALYGHHQAGAPQMTAMNAPPLRHAGENDQEGAVIRVVRAAMEQYGSGRNQAQQGAARPMRARGLCRVLAGHVAQNWVGTVETVTGTEKGNRVLSVRIAPDIVIKTWNNSLSDAFDHTMIERNSRLFGSVSNLRAGERVMFSGKFPPSATDCIEESSLTLHDSLTAPEFIMNFQSIAPID